MSKFYIIGKISRDLAKRMQSDPNADRGAAIKTICDTVGVKFHSYEWVRGRFDVISVIEGDYESVLGMKVAIMNAGLMEDIMIHEVFDYNKTFNKAADAGKNFKKPGE